MEKMLLTPGVGLTEEICKDFFSCGVDVITSGNHVLEIKKEIMSFIELKKIGFFQTLHSF